MTEQFVSKYAPRNQVTSRIRAGLEFQGEFAGGRIRATPTNLPANRSGQSSGPAEFPGFLSVGFLRGSRREEGGKVEFDGFGEGIEVIAPFEQADEASLAVGPGNFRDHFCEGGVILGFEAKGADGVESVGIEPGTEEDDLGTGAISGIVEHAFETGEVFLSGHSKSQGEIEGGSEPFSAAGFIGIPGSGIKRKPVSGEEEDAAGLVEDVLGSVTVMDVPIDDEDSVEAVVVQCPGGGDGDIVE